MPCAAVDVDEGVAGDPEREEVYRGAADDLVGAQVDREERVDQRERPPATIADEEADDPRPVPSAPQTPKNAPISIIPSSADVHDAASAPRTSRRAPRTCSGVA